MKRIYIVSERAFLMCPGMTFGICTLIRAGFDEQKINKVLHVLQEIHPLIKSVVARENDTGKLHYAISERMALKCSCRVNPDRLFADYQEQTSGGRNGFQEGLLKVFVYPAENKSFQILFIAHHLLCDGRGLLHLVMAFADLYVEGKVPAAVEEHPSMEGLPENCLPLFHKLIARYANKIWMKEKQSVAYGTYLDFEQRFSEENPVTYETEHQDGAAVEELEETCRWNELSVEDYLVAKMMCDEGISEMVIAVDLRNRLSGVQKNAFGNYATAVRMSVQKTQIL